MVGLLGLAGAPRAASADTKVGDTKDACDQHQAVTVTGKTGKVSVKAGDSAQIDLPAPVREITWFCGNSQEASSNDIPYDQIKLSRKPNGAMSSFEFHISTFI